MQKEFKDMPLKEFEEYVDNLIKSIEENTTDSKTDNNTIKNVDIIGTPGKMLVVVTNELGKETIYGNAVICAEKLGLNPTTIRSRCSHNKIDSNNKTWSYRENI